MSKVDREALDPAVWHVAAVVFIGPFMTQLEPTGYFVASAKL